MSIIVASGRISYLLELLGPAVLLPWPSGSKGDRRRWKHLELTDMDDGSHLAKLAKAGNIGVALGKVSNGLVTVDFDEQYYTDCFLKANPLLADTLRTRASRGCNIWVRCSNPYPSSCKLKNLSGKEIGEWRADGCQTIICGMHPDGVAYHFVVEKPVITIHYNEIIWPADSLIAPHATESKRVRGVGENKVVRVSAGNGSCGVIEAFSAGDLISQVAPTDCHQNNASLFKLARLVRSYERSIGRAATQQELVLVFDRWCFPARRFWRPGLTRDDYYAEFLEAYGYARIGLDENPVEVAVSRAKAAPLPEVPGFTDERIRLLVAMCREVQAITGANAFFLPTRKLGEILGVHHTRVARWLRALEALKIIHLAPGEVRKRGGNRSPRYHCNIPLRAAEGPIIPEPLAISDVSLIISGRKAHSSV
jgi:hypothetical protein